MRGCRMSVLARFVLLVALACGAAPFADHQPTVATPDDAPVATGQTRLRKLHLVRPDLIPYPISFEVYA